jgi:hypothetical protein
VVASQPADELSIFYVELKCSISEGHRPKQDL